MLSKYPWSSQKRQFWKRAEKKKPMICFYCQKVVRRDVDPWAYDRATIDHLVPISKGGRHMMSNFVISCFRCNQLKKDK